MANSLLQRGFEFYAAARSRAQRRKSLWNLILIPLGLAGWLGTGYLLFRSVWTFHVWLYPGHQFRNFWQEGISFSSFVPSFLMLFAPALGTIAFGFAIANCIAWLLAPARRVFDEEAAGYSGTSFRESTRALLRISLLTLPARLVVAMLAASLLRSLR